MFIRAFFLVFLKKYNYTPWENSLSFNLALIANSEPANTDIRFAPGFMLRIAIISRRSILLAYFPGVYPSSEKEKENYLRWHHQIVCVYTTTLTRAIGAFKRVRQFVPPSTHLTMYNSFIQPYFDYFLVLQCCLGGSGVWANSEASKVQNRAAGIITFSIVMILALAPCCKSWVGLYVLVIGAQVFGINYPRICVKANQWTFLNPKCTYRFPASLIP